MKEPLTKENAENWLVELITTPNTICDRRSFFYAVSAGGDKNRFDINQPGNGYALINLFGSNGDKSKRIDLDHLPERALALLAIIHREAYEYYKQIVQAKENPDANQSRE